MLPERIAHYEIKEKLGEGGTARVFRAYDTHYQRDVAVKIMLRRHLDNPSLRVRFNREAQTIAKLKHPTIVPLHDYGEFGPERLPFLVVGYMPRGSLKDRIKGPMQVREVLYVMQRIGRALDYAHSLNVIHRDIKPGNIIYSAEDHPHLTDFGIALVSNAGTTALSGDRLMVGTPHYMSPEQARGEELDARSDVYSLGIVLFEMLTGKRPYDDDTPLTPLAVIARHQQFPVPNVLEVNPDLPIGYRLVIEKAIAKNREDRYASATEMIADLREKSRSPAPSEVQNEKPAASQPQAKVTQPKDSKKRSPLAVLLGVFALLTLLVACIGGGVFAYSQGWLASIVPTADTVATVAATVDVTAVIDEGETPDPVSTTSPVEDSGGIATLAPEAPVEGSNGGDAEAGGTPVLRPTLAETPTTTAGTAGATNIGAQTIFLGNITNCQEGQVAEFQLGNRITFEWRFTDTLEGGEYLEIRVGRAGSDPLPIIGGQLPASLSSGESWFQQIDVADFIRNGVQEYEWQIAHMAANETPIQLSARGCLNIRP